MKDFFQYGYKPYNFHVTKQLESKKQGKKRITIIIYCNNDGSKNIFLQFIVMYAKPRYFKNVNFSSMNCGYQQTSMGE